MRIGRGEGTGRAAHRAGRVLSPRPRRARRPPSAQPRAPRRPCALAQRRRGAGGRHADAAAAQRLGHRRQAQADQDRHRPRGARPHPHSPRSASPATRQRCWRASTSICVSCSRCEPAATGDEAARSRSASPPRSRPHCAPQLAYLRAIRDVLPDDGVLIDELTQVGYTARSTYEARMPRSFISSGYQGTLGWSVATALGAKHALGDVPVVALSGDGGFMFNVQELVDRGAPSHPDRDDRVQRRRLRQCAQHAEDPARQSPDRHRSRQSRLRAAGRKLRHHRPSRRAIPKGCGRRWSRASPATSRR